MGITLTVNDLGADALHDKISQGLRAGQSPFGVSAVVTMLCLAGAVNRRAVIQPKANDTGWVVVPNLWGGIIAPPGFMKSPVIQAATRPLHQIQSEWRQQHEEALDHYDRDKEEYELRRAAWKEWKSAYPETDVYVGGPTTPLPSGPPGATRPAAARNQTEGR